MRVRKTIRAIDRRERDAQRQILTLGRNAGAGWYAG